jgi:hypothetical protein
MVIFPLLRRSINVRLLNSGPLMSIQILNLIARLISRSCNIPASHVGISGADFADDTDALACVGVWACYNVYQFMDPFQLNKRVYIPPTGL